MSTATSHSLPYDPATVEFDPLLRRLNPVANTRRRWRQLLDRAEIHGWSCRAFLGVRIIEEISHRQQTRIQRSVRQARFPFLNTVEEFDFSFQSRGTTALGTGWSDAGAGLRRGRGDRTADGVAGMGSTSQLRVPRAEHKREHNPVREVIHNVHRIKRPLPRTPTPFYRHLFLRGSSALTITRIHLDLPSGGGPNLPLLTSIEMTPHASAVVTFHRIHWKGSPECAIALRSETSLGMRMDKPPLNDIRVRHALQMALDLETVRDNYFLGFGDWQPMGSVGPAVTGYNNPFDTWPEELKKFWSYDPAGAERLLDEAGYPRGADGVRFQTSIMTNGDRGDVGYMELVAGYWKEIGVQAEIETPDNATYEGRRAALDFDGFLDFWAVGADYGNVASTLGQFRDDASYRVGTFSDPVFEAKYDELEAAAGDAEEHRRLAKALDMYVIEQHPYIYGPRVATFNVAQPWIVGYNGEMAIGNCAWNGPYARMWIDSQLKAELN